ncbi:hypothetical protein C8J56DRAFT_1163409 [Mycena floridula]|nr:hypothetical protein C8J56DRAFT_1163409 [Mycena floridula]
MRRSGSAPSAMTAKSSSPPPPYLAEFNFPSRKPQMETVLGSPLAGTFDWNAEQDEEDWLNEKSREEPHRAPLQSSGIYQESRTGPQPFARRCMRTSALCRRNIRSFLREFPLTPSRVPSAFPSPCHTPSPSISSPAYGTYSRYRKISVSHEDISLLADQNAELLLKLDKLEAESSSVELSGRRKLKKLEQELSLLRDELEQTQAKNSELEEKSNAAFGWDPERMAEEIERRKFERECRLRALRSEGIVSDDSSYEHAIKDFAPGGPLSSVARSVAFPSRSEPLASYSSFPDLPSSSSSVLPSHQSTHPRRSRKSLSISYSPAEPQLAVISQLLSKIQELEDTNAGIIEQQKETSNKLLAVQRETQNMSRVYECLSINGANLELVDDSFTAEDGQREGENTIRFRSLRRTIEKDDLMMMMGNESEMDSLGHLSGFRKPRKSVMNLFNSPAPSPTPSEKFPSSSSLYDTMSPTPSTDMSPLRTLMGFNSLKSELGSEYGEEWSLNNHHHLRTTSLYNISQLHLTPSSTPSRQLSPVQDLSGDMFPLLKTPVSNVLQLTLEPPTPPKAQFDSSTPSSSFDPGSLGARTSRYRRMSQTVRARTSKWADSRFGDSVLGDSPTTKETLSPESSPVRLENIFQQTVVQSGEVVDDDETNKQVVRGNKSDQYVLSRFIIEAWMWLQLFIIVAVFVFSTVRRGPKAILQQAEVKKAVVRTG